MLITFTLENWMSFRDRVVFSMIPSRERKHGDRVPKICKYNGRILPITVIYGGNASGKTNFFNALSFAKAFIVKGTQPENLIRVEPFRLDDSFLDKPSWFSFELLIGEIIYEFSFAVTRKLVLEEKLVVTTSSSEKVLYHRHDGRINFHSSVEDGFLAFAFQGTRDNQLFLTNAVSQKVDKFKPVYDWFKNSLEMVAPDSRFGPFEQFPSEGTLLYEQMNYMLRKLDTGILHLDWDKIPIENLSLPDSLMDILQEEIKEGETIRLLIEPNFFCVVTRKDDELIALKLVTCHQKVDGTEVKFDFRRESDGSQRLINLLPAFLDLATVDSKKVYVIDEIDRSLHTMLTRCLIEVYLAKCNKNSRKQLLLTTQDLLLMDQKIFRLDEMWLTERDIDGASNLLSFSEFDTPHA
ncbi:MAG: AAA family ATPase [Desulfovibrionaceae bacterium]|nr:AAA family ATPase [Desulfovibrionaceae bacterium]